MHYLSDPSGYISSPERTRYISTEDPYYYPPPRSGSITPVIIDEEARFRMEHMERQLANLTGLVQKALTPQPPTVAPPRHHSSTLPRNIGATNYSLVPQRDYIPTRDFRGECRGPGRIIRTSFIYYTVHVLYVIRRILGIA